MSRIGNETLKQKIINKLKAYAKGMKTLPQSPSFELYEEINGKLSENEERLNA